MFDHANVAGAVLGGAPIHGLHGITAGQITDSCSNQHFDDDLFVASSDFSVIKDFSLFSLQHFSN